MAMSKVDDAVVEIDQELAVLEPRLEGLYDYRRLNIHDDTRAQVESAIAVYERRILQLKATSVQLKSTQQDGHPGLPIREVEDSVLADLRANKETIDQALAQFASGAAKSFKFASTTEVKTE